MSASTVTLNGTTYRWPRKPVVVVCVDGGDPAYFTEALAKGAIPNTARFMAKGFNGLADGVVPSFTCPNNVSIITGSPPAVHGISGNFFLDPETRKAVVMTGPELMRADDPRRVLEGGRQGRLHHGQGQAAPTARQGHGHGPRRYQLLV